MNTTPLSSSTPVTLHEASTGSRRAPVWGAILGGAVAAVGTHILLMLLLAAIGLGAADPATDENPVATFGIGTAVAWSVSALISLFVGGWIAGRCAARVQSVSGGVHGFLVWCVATIFGLLMVTSGAGALIGGAARIAGQGVSALGAPLSGAADLAKQAVEENMTAISSMVEEVSQNPAVQNVPGGEAAARREIGQAVRQLFREGGNLRDPQARTATVQALTRAGISDADANRMVDGWISSIERMRTQFAEAKEAAAVKARQAADTASAAVSKAALWGFIGLLLGAIVASVRPEGSSVGKRTRGSRARRGTGGAPCIDLVPHLGFKPIADGFIDGMSSRAPRRPRLERGGGYPGSRARASQPALLALVPPEEASLLATTFSPLCH